MTPGGVGDTIISRHSIVSLVFSDCGWGAEVGEEDFGRGGGAGADWKLWMGRASKNSWAIMKGILSDSIMMLA